MQQRSHVNTKICMILWTYGSFSAVSVDYHFVVIWCGHSASIAPLLIISVGNSLHMGEKCVVECYSNNLFIIDSHYILRSKERVRRKALLWMWSGNLCPWRASHRNETRPTSCSLL